MPPTAAVSVHSKWERGEGGVSKMPRLSLRGRHKGEGAGEYIREI